MKERDKQAHSTTEFNYYNFLVMAPALAPSEFGDHPKAANPLPFPYDLPYSTFKVKELESAGSCRQHTSTSPIAEVGGRSTFTVG